MKPKLSKEVCQKCYQKRGRKWDLWYEGEKWSNARVYCGRTVVATLRMIRTNELPELCPYKLEHLVMGNQDEDETQ